MLDKISMGSFSRVAAVQLVVLILLLPASPFVSAYTAGGNFSLGLQHTDNVRLVPVNEEDDQILTTQLTGAISKDSGPLTGNATASYSNLKYLDDTYSEQNYFRLDSNLQWVQIENRLVWNVSDYYDQSKVDSLTPGTPDNIEDVNAFNISAGLTLPVADRHTISVRPSFQDFQYDSSDTDNQQAGLAVAWSYQFRPTISVLLGGDVTEVKYDDSQSNPDYTTRRLDAGVTFTRSRYNLSILAGTTNIKRDVFSDVDGFNAMIRLDMELSSRSSLVAVASSDLTDTSTTFLSSETDPNSGSFGNVQNSGDVLRNGTFRFTYLRNDVNTNLQVWTELNNFDYEVAPDDRDVQEVGANLSYQLTARLGSRINGSFTRADVNSPSRTDETTSLVAGLSYMLSRRVAVNTTVTYNKRDSTDPSSEYDELGIYAGIGVSFGN